MSEEETKANNKVIKDGSSEYQVSSDFFFDEFSRHNPDFDRAKYNCLKQKLPRNYVSELVIFLLRLCQIPRTIASITPQSLQTICADSKAYHIFFFYISFQFFTT